MPTKAIHTDQAPKAIGPYSQAVRAGDTVYLAGQIPLDPATMQMVEGDFEAEARRVFENIKAVIAASGGTFAQVAKVTIFLTDFANFAKVNDLMAQYFTAPYPARSTVAVAGSSAEVRHGLLLVVLGRLVVPLVVGLVDFGNVVVVVGPDRVEVVHSGSLIMTSVGSSSRVRPIDRCVASRSTSWSISMGCPPAGCESRRSAE